MTYIKGGEILKKYRLIAGLIGIIAIVGAGMVASHTLFNEPRIPSMLSK
jgi:hypothetical protein